MREIKFRAWGIKEKAYLKLCSIHLSTKRVIVSIFGRAGGNISLPFSRVILEQYTGLKDKNGKEIYEGDIVEVCAMKMGGQILYDDVEYFAYLIVGFIADEPLKIHLGNFEWHKLEIIGNIHENPELLGEEEE